MDKRKIVCPLSKVSVSLDYELGMRAKSLECPACGAEVEFKGWFRIDPHPQHYCGAAKEGGRCTAIFGVVVGQLGRRQHAVPDGLEPEGRLALSMKRLPRGMKLEHGTSLRMTDEWFALEGRRVWS